MNSTFIGLVAVGAGAALGAWCRWGLSAWLNPRWLNFPAGTFAANALGGLLVGIAIAWLAAAPNLSPAWRLFVITGFLGGLTTFSSYSAEVIALIERSQLLAALSLALAHLLVSFGLTALGLVIGRALWRAA